MKHIHIKSISNVIYQLFNVQLTMIEFDTESFIVDIDKYLYNLLLFSYYSI